MSFFELEEKCLLSIMVTSIFSVLNAMFKFVFRRRIVFRFHGLLTLQHGVHHLFSPASIRVLQLVPLC
jgi:hypothetical protein